MVESTEITTTNKMKNKTISDPPFRGFIIYWRPQGTDYKNKNKDNELDYKTSWNKFQVELNSSQSDLMEVW